MTVISYQRAHSIATTFSGNYLVRTKVFAITAPWQRLKLQHIARKSLAVAGALLGVVSFAGILAVGVSSIQLALTTQTVEKEIQELSKTNETLVAEVSALRAPDALSAHAAVLELQQPSRIQYVTIEKEVIAGTQPYQASRLP